MISDILKDLSYSLTLDHYAQLFKMYTLYLTQSQLA